MRLRTAGAHGPALVLLVAAPLAAAQTRPAASPPASRAATSAATPDAAPDATVAWSAGSLRGRRPSAWVEEKPASPMRKAQFVLPRAEGDGEDATSTLYHFGAAAGSREANLERWMGQMAQPDGRLSKDVAKVERRKVHGMDLAVLTLSGRYQAEVMPGGAVKADKPGFRMIAAILEAPDGAYYLKVVGPEKTVARWERSVQAFLDSLEPASP